MVPDFEQDNNGWELFGGQPKYAVEFEREMCYENNNNLKKYGIKPVMICKGYWEYPVKKKEFCAAASVIEVKGDTRLDELMAVIETAFEYAIVPAAPNKNGLLVAKRIGQLYYDLGFVVGQLKRIMVKHGQTWSSDTGPSNANTGNIVLCSDDYNVRIGLVDLDASCNNTEFPSEKIADMHIEECKRLMLTAYIASGSQRKAPWFAWKASRFDEQEYPLICLRKKLVEGFLKGGLSRKIRDTTVKGIPVERFEEITNMIQNTCLRKYASCVMKIDGSQYTLPLTRKRVDTLEERIMAGQKSQESKVISATQP